MRMFSCWNNTGCSQYTWQQISPTDNNRSPFLPLCHQSWRCLGQEDLSCRSKVQFTGAVHLLVDLKRVCPKEEFVLIRETRTQQLSVTVFEQQMLAKLSAEPGLWGSSILLSVRLTATFWRIINPGNMDGHAVRYKLNPLTYGEKNKRKLAWDKQSCLGSQ